VAEEEEATRAVAPAGQQVVSPALLGEDGHFGASGAGPFGHEAGNPVHGGLVGAGGFHLHQLAQEVQRGIGPPGEEIAEETNVGHHSSGGFFSHKDTKAQRFF
jgi:hypothetical protein